jgi:hypothetical protein
MSLIERYSQVLLSAHRLFSRAALSSVAAAAALLVCVGGAHADPTALGPPPARDNASSQKKFEEVAPHDDGTLMGGSPSGDLGTLNLERFQISTQSGYITLRGEQSRYVVGLGRNEWGIDIARNRSTSSWAWGYLTGANDNPVQKCLYAEFAYLNRAATGATRDCSTTGDLPPSGYMALFNGNRDGVNCKRDPVTNVRTCDGSNVTIDGVRCPGGANVYPNVQPWTDNAARAVSAYTIPAGATVKWRYVTKDWRHTMMRYEGPKPFAQDWGFIDGNCISNYGYYEWWNTA